MGLPNFPTPPTWLLAECPVFSVAWPGCWCFFFFSTSLQNETSLNTLEAGRLVAGAKGEVAHTQKKTAAPLDHPFVRSILHGLVHREICLNYNSPVLRHADAT